MPLAPSPQPRRPLGPLHDKDPATSSSQVRSGGCGKSHGRPRLRLSAKAHVHTAADEAHTHSNTTTTRGIMAFARAHDEQYNVYYDHGAWVSFTLPVVDHHSHHHTPEPRPHVAKTKVKCEPVA